MFRYRFALLLLAAAAACSQDYSLGPDSQRRAGVPQGKVSKFTWANSKIYPGTTRDYWVYVPAEYEGSKPACVMIFQDGAGFVSETGAWRVPTVFDNLIQERAMPVTIGVFIDPGVMPAAGQQSRFNRSYEYDGLGSRYAKFLVEEILPEVGKQYKLSSDPNDRAIAGSSSGGIAAFTAAWERPDAFRRVLSFIGSFTNLRGGDVYANLIRKMEPLPLRVFLQDGSKDLDIYSGAWWLAAQTMARSLEYAGYDTRFVAGTEAHNSRHGAAILPEALRWLWRGYPAPIEVGKGGSEDRHFISEILDPGHDWELAGEGYPSASAITVDKTGNIYLGDPTASKIYKSGTDGKISVFSSDTGGAGGLTFGADGRLYAAEKSRRRIAAYSPDGKATVLASGVEPDDVAVTPQGAVYFTNGRRVWLLPPGGSPRAVFEGMSQPRAVRLSPDHSLLVVTDAASRFAWSFHLQPDGSLADGEPFYRLETPDDAGSAGAESLAYDDQGYAYMATALGIQICDQPGRVTGIIRSPGGAVPTAVAFGGPDGQTLYATAGGKLYRRHLRRKGAPPWAEVSLPRPQL